MAKIKLFPVIFVAGNERDLAYSHLLHFARTRIPKACCCHVLMLSMFVELQLLDAQ